MEESPPLPFYQPDSSKEAVSPTKVQTFKRVDPNDANNSTKINIPIFDSSTGTNEDLLRTISCFNKSCPKLGWTNGTKKFSNFELVITGACEATWSRLIEGVSATNENFVTCIQDFVHSFISKDDAFFTQREHLQNVHKTRNMTVRTFILRLQEYNDLMAELPGQDPDVDEIFTDVELIRIIYNAMPRIF